MDCLRCKPMRGSDLDDTLPLRMACSDCKCPFEHEVMIAALAVIVPWNDLPWRESEQSHSHVGSVSNGLDVLYRIVGFSRRPAGRSHVRLPTLSSACQLKPSKM